jgi:septal ring factor EnvC (AmiA/AmiB activator)
LSHFGPDGQEHVPSCGEMTMTSFFDENNTLGTESHLDELSQLRSRIDRQSDQLSKHARDLTQLHEDLAQLNERLDAHQYSGATVSSPLDERYQHDRTRPTA